MEGLISPPIAQNNSNTSNNGLFNPFLISILGIVVTVTAILIYHFILLEYCTRRHAATTTITTAAEELKTTGVDEKILQKLLPILTFSAVKRRRFHTDQEECVVCLGELEDEDMVRFLPNCSHAFHVACIDRWFSAHASCPLCRSPVAEEPPNTPPRRSTNNSDHLKNSNGTSTSSGESQSPPTVQSSGQYRHCVTLALPAARSLSMDQSFVALNLQISYNCSSTSSRGELTSSDRASSKLLNSFSLLRLGKGIDPPILPY